ncbi:unnamed protein product [Trichogramma brassicae]|uniref:Uncharacterized protein n=1 Tax=Trichogramma brassicae TaxID=86971 RepID=A0A6H5IYU6_9HYME|nr:unnamed protein product [Trichogramma brassicae]
MDAISLDEESTFERVDSEIRDYDYDSEDSEYYGQVNAEKLKELREKVNWEILAERRNFLGDFYSLIRDWKGRLPNLRDVFRGAEIDQLVRESIEYVNCGNDEIDLGTLVRFVIATGYRDEPDQLDDAGKPVALRSTALHYAAKTTHDYVVADLFDLYDRYDVNYVDESGLTHFHVACKYGCQEVVEKFLKLGQDPNVVWRETGDSPLHLAMEYYQPRVISSLLSKDADPNLANEDGSTCLHLAAKRKFDDLAEMVFERSLRPVLVDARDREGKTPLQQALQGDDGRPKILRVLLLGGADPNAADENGWTPLHHLCRRHDQGRGPADFFFETIDEYAAKRLNVDAQDESGETPLHLAVRSDNREMLELLLLRRGADPSLANYAKGETPLHCAMSRDDNFLSHLPKPFLELIDRCGGKLDARDKSGDTPLHSALRLGRRVWASELLRRGADPNLANDEGSTSLHVICQRPEIPGSPTDYWLNMLFCVCYDDRLETQREVLVDARDNLGRTPLYLALSKDNFNWGLVDELLITGGTDPYAVDAEGSTLLHLAARCSGSDDQADRTASHLFELESWPVPIDARDERGRTPLHLALAHGRKKLAESLLRRGADPHSTDASRGSTALHVACKRGAAGGRELDDDGLVRLIFEICDELEETRFDEAFEGWDARTWRNFKLDPASSAPLVLERLKNMGYELDRSDAYTLMKFFVKNGLFDKSADLEKCCYDDEEFASKAEKIMIDSGLSLYDLMQLRPKEAAQLVAVYRDVAYTNDEFMELPEGPREACVSRLCEKLLRRFYSGWALELFMELIHFRLPILCCDAIVEQLANEDLWRTCLAAADQSSLSSAYLYGRSRRRPRMQTSRRAVRPVQCLQLQVRTSGVASLKSRTRNNLIRTEAVQFTTIIHTLRYSQTNSTHIRTKHQARGSPLQRRAGRTRRKPLLRWPTTKKAPRAGVDRQRRLSRAMMTQRNMCFGRHEMADLMIRYVKMARRQETHVVVMLTDSFYLKSTVDAFAFVLHCFACLLQRMRGAVCSPSPLDARRRAEEPGREASARQILNPPFDKSVKIQKLHLSSGKQDHVQFVNITGSTMKNSFDFERNKKAFAFVLHCFACLLQRMRGAVCSPSPLDARRRAEEPGREASARQIVSSSIGAKKKTYTAVPINHGDAHRSGTRITSRARGTQSFGKSRSRLQNLAGRGSDLTSDRVRGALIKLYNQVFNCLPIRGTASILIRNATPRRIGGCWRTRVSTATATRFTCSWRARVNAWPSRALMPPPNGTLSIVGWSVRSSAAVTSSFSRSSYARARTNRRSQDESHRGACIGLFVHIASSADLVCHPRRGLIYSTAAGVARELCDLIIAFRMYAEEFERRRNTRGAVLSVSDRTRKTTRRTRFI